MSYNEKDEAPTLIDTSKKASQVQQIDLAERLQYALLQYFERKLRDGGLTDTGAATLARLLQANGWTLDPTRIPQTIKDKLTSTIDPTTLDDGDVDVIGKIA